MGAQRVARAEHVAPGGHSEIASALRSAGIADEDEMSQVGAAFQHFVQRCCALRRSDEHAHVAVAQDVLNLRRFQYRVDRHEHAAGARSAEHRDDVLELLGQVDRDAVLTLETERVQRRRERIDLTRERGVGEAFTLETQRRR